MILIKIVICFSKPNERREKKVTLCDRIFDMDRMLSAYLHFKLSASFLSVNVMSSNQCWLLLFDFHIGHCLGRILTHEIIYLHIDSGTKTIRRIWKISADNRNSSHVNIDKWHHDWWFCVRNERCPIEMITYSRRITRWWSIERKEQGEREIISELENMRRSFEKPTATHSLCSAVVQ